MCSVWGGDKILTFDQVGMTHSGKCRYTLVSDCEGGSFDMTVAFDEDEVAELKMEFGSNNIRVGQKGIFVNDEK